MSNNLSIWRIVPNIYSQQYEKSKQFYTEFLDMELAMDMGWILTFISKENPTAQISIFKNEENKTLDNSALFISIEVADVDARKSKRTGYRNRVCYQERTLGSQALFCERSQWGDHQFIKSFKEINSFRF